MQTATSRVSYVSHLLVTLPLDSAIQWWATSWLLYNLTKLFNGEPPLDYSGAWLSYSMVSYLLISLQLASLLSNLHIVLRLPHKLPPLDWAASWLSYPSIKLLLDWAIQLTKLPLGFVTLFTESMASYLLITLQLDWATQVWATSFWLYLLTAPFNGELPLDHATTWRS